MTLNELQWASVSPKDLPLSPHWAPMTAPMNSNDLQWEPRILQLISNDSRWAPMTPADRQFTYIDIYWVTLTLTPTASHWTQYSLHWTPLSHINPLVTHNDPSLSQMTPIWSEIRSSTNCFRRPQPQPIQPITVNVCKFSSKKDSQSSTITLNLT